MIETVIRWSWRHLRPAEGWLSIVLMLGIVTTLVIAVDSVRWVPEGSVVVSTAFLGLLLVILLAKRPLNWPLAWFLIFGYGLILTTIRLARLWPPFSVLATGWEAGSAYTRQNWGLFVDRAGSWLAAAQGGGRTEETIVFAFGLGLLAWLLVAYAGWSTFRQHKPLAGLTVVGVALAINGYYGNMPIWPAALYVALTVLLVATIHYAEQERVWMGKAVDFSGEIRFDLLLFSGVIALMLLAVSLVVPAINMRAISRAVLDRPSVHETEDTLGRVFAGVRQPLQEGPAFSAGLDPGTTTRSGSFPRSFLLGQAPELYETVVMTATVDGSIPTPTHWRGLSYDVYTGRGWALSTEREEPIIADQPIPLPPRPVQSTLNQSVYWAQEPPAIRYTMGLPLQFDQEVIIYWRGLEDLSRVESDGGDYIAASRVVTASMEELNSAVLAEVPPAIMGRYTRLPDSVPDRVHELAHQVAGDAADGAEGVQSPYEQAKALERFLRQYPYSLDVELPPIGADPVDHFLFDLQAGYCDYYASSMVVMARSLGLPARFAAGFLSQYASPDGVQTIYQINAHSWAEIYFAGYGWVEFEPTAAFPAEAQELLVPLPFDGGVQEVDLAPAPPPIPGQESLGPAFLRGLAFLALALAGWWLWRRRQRERAAVDETVWAYGRLQHSAQRLGRPASPSQTPAEFESALLDRLRQLEKQPLTGQIKPVQLSYEIEQLVSQFINRQYAGRKPQAEAAVASWRKIRGRLWLLGALERLRTLVTRSPADR